MALNYRIKKSSPQKYNKIIVYRDKKIKKGAYEAKNLRLNSVFLFKFQKDKLNTVEHSTVRQPLAPHKLRRAAVIKLGIPICKSFCTEFQHSPNDPLGWRGPPQTLGDPREPTQQGIGHSVSQSTKVAYVIPCRPVGPYGDSWGLFLSNFWQMHQGPSIKKCFQFAKGRGSKLIKICPMIEVK